MPTKSADAPNGTAKRRKPAAKKETPAAPAPTREEIARLAEKFWAERGWPEGSPTRFTGPATGRWRNRWQRGRWFMPPTRIWLSTCTGRWPSAG